MREELWYVVLVFALFVLPQALTRLRLPTAISSLALGAAAGLGFGLFEHDHTIWLLSVFGIVSLFLFAGLEVDLAELRERAPEVLQHLGVRVLTLAATALAASWLFPLDTRAAVIVALALLTPSTGFILSSLPEFGLSPEESRLVKMKAIAGELLALGALFVCTQSESGERLLMSGLAMSGLVVVMPVALWVFARFIMPRAPRSEFAFLLVLAVGCASATRMLGAYFLLGAFLAGMIAQRTRAYVPELVSPRIIDAIELFASFFIPFYFFHAGLELRAADFSLRALALAGALLAVVLPLRLAAIVAHRRVAFGQDLRSATRVAIALQPTLVFTLVLAGILRDQFQAPPELVGALLIYTLANTCIPGFVLARAARIDFTAPEAAPAPPVSEPGTSALRR
jgi:Kef-type K+ transport system membrane component KefB